MEVVAKISNQLAVLQQQALGTIGTPRLICRLACVLLTTLETFGGTGAAARSGGPRHAAEAS